MYTVSMICISFLNYWKRVASNCFM